MSLDDQLSSKDLKLRQVPARVLNPHFLSDHLIFFRSSYCLYSLSPQLCDFKIQLQFLLLPET